MFCIKDYRFTCFYVKKKNIFAASFMAIIAQLVRVPDCGSEGRGFESHWSPKIP